MICDSPAKTFLIYVKGHNARFGCNTWGILVFSRG